MFVYGQNVDCKPVHHILGTRGPMQRNIKHTNNSNFLLCNVYINLNSDSYQHAVFFLRLGTSVPFNNSTVGKHYTSDKSVFS